MAFVKDSKGIIGDSELTILASVYECSKQSLELRGEVNRTLFPEDLAWSQKKVLSLREISLRAMANSLKSESYR